eukprot:gene12585-12716_t
MGRGQSKKQRLMRKDFAGGGSKRDSKWSEQRNAKSQHFLEAKDLKNEAFDEYYKTQDIVPAGEWEDFVDCLRRPLPITFRINGSGKFANELREKMETDFFKQFKQGPITIDGEVVHPPRPLPWYPSNLGWHMNFSRNQLRKLSWLGDIHQWMKGANEAGSITRQEAVSMVPPMFMDVQPHHRVLDMCAAPGSKTFQLLEMLHDMDNASKSSGSGSTPGGFVVANDADAQRCNLLTHQTKRIGDGTMRKAPDIWRRWSVVNGNGLHCMQLKIALQAVRLLKVGGRMVYSTCTFNPIEDEAVVAELLLRCGGALQLVDVSQELPELIRCPGKRQWRVRDKYQWYDTWEEAQKIGFKLDPSMFSTPEKQQLPLERCLRILPHHQDPTTSHRFSRIIPAGRDGRLIKAEGLDPHQGAADAAAYAIEMLVSFYGVETGFPLTTHLITRSLEALYPKRIYYVSDSLLGLLLADKDEKLKITSTGLKIFERHELRGKESGKCQYRIAQEGLPFLLPHLTKQVVRLGVDDFTNGALTVNAPLAISVWKTRASLSVLVAKAECEQLVEKIKGAVRRQQQGQLQEGQSEAAANPAATAEHAVA